MTLVLCQLSPDWVIIAADRMLSHFGRQIADNSIKLVQFYNECVFGITGQWQMLNNNGKWLTADRWLVEVLVAVGVRSVPIALEAIRENVSVSFGKMEKMHPGTVALRHAFLAVGWDKNTAPGRTEVDPIVAIISNHHSEDGRSMRTTTREFSKFARALREPLVVGTSVGQPQSSDEEAWLKSQLDNSHGPTAIQCVHMLKSSIRQASKRLKGEYVNKDVMALAIPRSAAFCDSICVLGPNGESGVVFQNGTPPRYVPPANCSYFLRFRDGTDFGVYEAPHVVCPGFDSFGCLISSDGGSRDIKSRVITDAAGKPAGLMGTKATIKQKPTRSQRRKFRNR